MKKTFIGIDVGTSALKLLLVDEDGKILNSVSKAYPLTFPREGWAEQNAQDYWLACEAGLGELLKGFDAQNVYGIGAGGQMHGLVCLDKDDHLIRPVILWNDGRTAGETEYLNEQIGREVLSSRTGNIAYAGFTAPKLLWMQKNEPALFEKIKKIMLPKDYITFRLTGNICTDYSDASGTLLLDVQQKRWNGEMLSLCGLKESALPVLYESYEVAGTVKASVAEKFGFRKNCIVVAGAGDNAAAAIGTGAVEDGNCNISLGTSGTVFVSRDQFSVPPHHTLHSFAHANGKYHLMGVVLSAASCNKWWCEEILRTDHYSAEQNAVSRETLGNNTVYFLPYLMGERSPLNDPYARGVFWGLHMNTRREEMMAAVLEGVSYAIRDSLEAARQSGSVLRASTLCGGGAKSSLWRTILANVLNIPLFIPAVEEGPAYGGAMLAMTGSGIYENIASCSRALVRTSAVTEPETELVQRYEEGYRRFSQIYPAQKELFKTLYV